MFLDFYPFDAIRSPIRGHYTYWMRIASGVTSRATESGDPLQLGGLGNLRHLILDSERMSIVFSTYLRQDTDPGQIAQGVSLIN